MRYGGYSGGRGERGRGAPASRGPSQAEQRSQAAREVEARMSNVRAPESTPAFLKPTMVSIAEVVGGVMGDYLRQGIISRLEAGGTPVREGGLVIGVEKDGQYFGRTRQADRAGGGDGEGRAAAPSAQMGAAAPQPEQPAAKTVRRSALVQQIEEENRRRRLAGMRRLGSRTLLSGDRLSADTLGAA